MSDSSHSIVNECPSFEALVGFDLGELTDLEFETIASHLSKCQKCVSILAEWHSRSTDEKFVERLRDCMVDPPTAKIAPIDPAYAETASGTPAVDASTISSPDDAEKIVRQPQILVGRAVGRYVILRKLGSGGMGVVYLAKDPVVSRPVALKMLSAESVHKKNRLARFWSEGKVLATLRHPNVVQFYHFDEYADLPYFTMEYVEGKTLQEFVPENHAENRHSNKQPSTIQPDRKLSLRATVELIKTLALAVHAIHERGVIHRDLKPANVLIQTDGTAKIADFGLAKLVEEEGRIDLTQTGCVMGTASYMSPEQAAGRVREIGPRSDVYGLGAVFYELLAGQPPHRGDSFMDTLKRVIDEEPVSPRSLRPDVPKLLELICFKALEKKPADRHESARALADDLDDWLNGQHPRSLPGAVRRTLQPTRRKAILVGLGTAATAIGAYAYRTNPDVIRNGIEADLRAGKPVTLIGEKGPPRWMKWVAGEQLSKIVSTKDEPFTVQTNGGTSLIELAPDPQSDRFVITAQVRHVAAETRHISSSGIFVAGSTVVTGKGPASFFIEFVFNDVLDENDQKIIFPDGQPQSIQEKNNLILRPRLIGNSDNLLMDRGMLYQTPGKFDSAGESMTVWRKVEISVSPDGIEASLDGVKTSLSSDFIGNAIRFDVNKPQSKNIYIDSIPQFVPRGGLGILVNRGTTAIRSLVISSSGSFQHV